MLLPWLALSAWAGVGGSISGTVTDPSGAVVPKATVTATNTDTGIRQTVATDDKGFYSFPSLPIGHYDLEITSAAFRPYRRTGIVIDANSALTVDAVLEVGERSDVVTVVENQLHVETTSTQMGEVITGAQMTAVPLNGRSFTDLLALQPGVAPVTSITSDTVQDVGASVLSPSGDLNPGTISINGQREFANSFIVNGSDVEEDVNMGAAIIPNLDSIAEFRILTNNFDAEYGEFSGGQINVVTKVRHQCFSRRRFRIRAQHQPRRAQLLFSHARRIRSKPVRRDVRRADPQEQDFLLRRLSGDSIDPGSGHRPDSRSVAAGPDRQSVGSGELFCNHRCQWKHGPDHGERTVLGQPPFAEAGLRGLRGRALLHAGMHQRNMRFPGRRDPAERVVRAGNQPVEIHSRAQQRERHIFHFGLQSNLAGRQRRLPAGRQHALGTCCPPTIFSTTGRRTILTRSLKAERMSRASTRSTPAARNCSIWATRRRSSATAVNEFHFSYMRDANDLGKPVGGVGVSLASQGFESGPGTPGIVALSPKTEGVESVGFNSFTIGTNTNELNQVGNTFQWLDNFSKVIGTHTLKFGGEFHYDQVNVNAIAQFNGSFLFFGSRDRLRLRGFSAGNSEPVQPEPAAAFLRPQQVRGPLCAR